MFGSVSVSSHLQILRNAISTGGFMLIGNPLLSVP
jgi:hypothetical protein